MIKQILQHRKDNKIFPPRKTLVSLLVLQIREFSD